MVARDNLNVIHACAAGLDVHKMEVTATVRLSQAGAEAELHTEVFSALPDGLAALVAWLRAFGVTAAVMEGTGVYWEAPFDALEAAGIQAMLVHAQHVKQLKGRKTDIADSIWLARICAFGLCSPSVVPPARFRSLRKVSRMRRQLVRERARVRNRIHKLVDSAGLRVGGVLSDLFGANGMRILDGLVAGHAADDILASLSRHVRHLTPELTRALKAMLDEDVRYLLADQHRAYRQLSERITQYDAVLTNGLADYREQIALLTTIPGINQTAATAIFIELGPDITVFGSLRKCMAWAGLCPGNNESAGKRRSGHTRRGNNTLREVLIECAHAAARTRDCQFHGYHKSLTVRRGYRRATVATAHKMLRAAVTMLATGEPYRDPEANYEALMVRRNAPRWIAMLKKYNCHLALDPETA